MKHTVPEITVLYDGACPVCSREVDMYRRARRGYAVRWIDATATDPASVVPGLDRTSALSSLYAVTQDGRVLNGVASFRAVWAALPGFRWLSRASARPAVSRWLDSAYARFLAWRGPRVAARDAFTALPLWLQRDLRADHAGEVGAVAIYRGLGRTARTDDVRAMALEHGATERRHRDTLAALVPRPHRSRLLFVWRLMAFGLGALAGLGGRRAAYLTIDAVETFVDAHYGAQLERLAATPALHDIATRLAACHADELAHRDEARAALGHATGALAASWRAIVASGSRLAVAAARRV